MNEYIEETNWDGVRDDVIASSKELADIIDRISPDKKLKLFRIKYPFGMKILENTQFLVPLGNHSIPLDSPSTPQTIREKLNYSSVPLGIIVKGSAEVYQEFDDKIFSLAFFEKGLEMGVWEYHKHMTPYTVTSGARSLYMLPRISDAVSHKRLEKEYSIKSPPPRNLIDHWDVFVELANSPKFPTQWNCEFIWLTSDWIEKIENDKKWMELANHILKCAWAQSSYARNKKNLDVVWEYFSRMINMEQLKFDTYIIDTLKHLVLIGTGQLPALVPHTGDNKSGPLNEIQSIYESANGYNITGYIPTIMQPSYFSSDTKSVYYSLQLPTLLESMPRLKSFTTAADKIKELQKLIDYFIKMDHWSRLKNSINRFNEIVKLKFEFFHDEMSACGSYNILPANEITTKDKSFLFEISKNKRAFAYNSSFLKGCIRISANGN